MRKNSIFMLVIIMMFILPVCMIGIEHDVGESKKVLVSDVVDNELVCNLHSIDYQYPQNEIEIMTKESYEKLTLMGSIYYINLIDNSIDIAVVGNIRAGPFITI